MSYAVAILVQSKDGPIGIEIMGRLITWLFLLITVAALRSTPGFAQACSTVNGDGSGPIIINSGHWQYWMHDPSLTGDSTRRLHKSAIGLIDACYVSVGHAGLQRSRISVPSSDWRTADAAGPAVDSRMKLDYDLHLRTGMNEIRFDRTAALPVSFQAISTARALALESRGEGDTARTQSGANDLVPEPDGWAMLIAGLLGMCTVARRRILSIDGIRQ